MSIDRRSLAATIIGHTLGFYDVVLFGYLAPFLATLFFPSQNPSLSLMVGFVAFAAAFLTRPLGGMVFGYFGDRYGRKNTLVISMFFLAVPAFTIGILPTYAEIGFMAPVILILSRLLQGLCMGGEYNGSGIYAVEHAPSSMKGFAGSLVLAGGYVGSVLASLLGALFTLPLMPSWGWRIPFVIGGLTGLLGFYFRKRMKETPEFCSQSDSPSKAPLAEILRYHKRAFFCTLGIGCTGVIQTILSIYINGILITDLGVQTSLAMGINAGIALVWMITLPLMGKLSDLVGYRRLMLISSLGLSILAYPAFIFITPPYLSVVTVVSVRLGLSILAAAYFAPIHAMMAELFPVHCRYSGVSTGYSLSVALFGGTAPLASMVLVIWSGNPRTPALIFAIGALASAMGVYYGRQHH